MSDISFLQANFPLVKAEFQFLERFKTSPYSLSSDKDGQSELHQYTRVETVRSMLTIGEGPVPQELWATSTPYMNDLQEFEHGKDLFIEVLNEYREKPGTLHIDWSVGIMREIASVADGRDVFCACLSAKADDLNQWRGYTDGGRGCCVSYRYEDLLQAIPPTAGWIVYEAKSQRDLVKKLVDGFTTAVARSAARKELERLEPLFRQRLKRFLPTVFPFFKHPSFYEEQEFRVVYSPDDLSKPLPVQFRTDGSRLIPYVKLRKEEDKKPVALPLTCVTFGPGSKGPNNEAALRRLLDSRGLTEDKVAVKGSEIPFLPTG